MLSNYPEPKTLSSKPKNTNLPKLNSSELPETLEALNLE